MWASSQLPACLNTGCLLHRLETGNYSVPTAQQTDCFIQETLGGATRYLNSFHGIINAASICTASDVQWMNRLAVDRFAAR